METTRAEAFSDGVFAIAITLLVLDIPVPELANRDSSGDLFNALTGLVPSLASFGLSFYLVGQYWVRHHQLFRTVVRGTVRLLYLNLAVLFLICLTPFVAAVFSRYIDTKLAVTLYGIDLAGVGVAFSAVRIYVDRAGLLRTRPTQRQRRLMLLEAISLPVSILVFVAVFQFNGWVAGACLFAAQLSLRFVRRRLGSRRDTAGSAAPRS